MLRTNRLAEASPLLDELLAYRVRKLGPAHTQTLTTMGDLAWVRQLQGAFAEAEAILLEAIPPAREKLGDDHPRVLSLLNNLAQRRPTTASSPKPSARSARSSAVVLRVYGPDHRNTLTVAGMHAQFLTAPGTIRRGRRDPDRLRRAPARARLARTTRAR